MKTHLKSRLLAVMLTLGTASSLTIAAPMSAQAGVLGSIKSAAKSVGGAIKTGASATAKVVNKVAKPVVVNVVKPVGKVVGSGASYIGRGFNNHYVKPFVATGKEIAKKF